jgi:hypothetical protein
VTVRCLLVCSALLLFASGAYAGIYQRAKDGRTLVWNNYPKKGDEATWSGNRDPNGYAVGSGTLTWYRVEPKIVTGSNIPSVTHVVVVGRYSGNMVRGKLEGPVINVEADGKTFHGTFVNGAKSPDWAGGPAPSRNPQSNAVSKAPVREKRPTDGGAVTKAPALEKRPTDGSAVTKAPAVEQQPSKRVEGGAITKAPTPEQRPNERVYGGVVIESPSEGPDSLQSFTPPSSLKTPTPVRTEAALQASISSAASSRSSSPEDVNLAADNRIIADFKEQTRSVLSRVGDATGDFHEIDRLDSVKKLPAPVSESIDSLVDRARDFRSKPEDESVVQECQAETQTVAALSVIDEITQNIAANDASEAGSRLAVFLKRNPEPTVDGQKAVWRYLSSLRLLCSRLEKDAYIHVQRAQSLAAAGKTSDAIREYQEAYQTFPNPETAEKIRQLQDSSLGL